MSAETARPPVRISRVTTRGIHLQTIQCPLDPEMLIAEFSGELPPEVAHAVQEHLVFCESCNARSRALRAPYELISSLGFEPVPYVPDLRDSVKLHVRARQSLRNVQRFTASLGRMGSIGLTAVLGMLVLIAVLAGSFIYTAVAGIASRSRNGLTNVPAAAQRGVLYAQTNKLIPVQDAQGRTWNVAEIIVVDERTGKVLRSLPDSQETLHLGSKAQLPVDVLVRGDTVAELTAPASDGSQALVVFDTDKGALRFVTRLTLPDGRALTQAMRADSLLRAPDGSAYYIGLRPRQPGTGEPRALIVSGEGTVTGTLAPGFGRDIPLPPPPGSLPPSAFPSVVPYLDASQMRVAQGTGDALSLSPDGLWLYDVLVVSGTKGERYAVIRRFATADGSVAQELALPAGSFDLARMTVAETPLGPQLYLVTGSPAARAYILDAGAEGPALIADLPLGGPASIPGATFSGTLNLSPSADGTRLYITQDVTSSAGGSGHDTWVLDTQGTALIAHQSTLGEAGAILLNTAKDDPSARMFVLRNGEVGITGSDILGALTPWLKLSDGQPIIRLLGTANS